MPNFDEEGIIEPDMFAETWFSADGASWELIGEQEPVNFEEAWTLLVAVGDDEVLLRSEASSNPPEELLDDPAALEAWFNSQSIETTWTAIPVG